MVDAFLQQLDEIVLLSSNAALQRRGESTVFDFYSVNGFETLSAFKCGLF
jgi:hypothetical protein